MKAYGKHSFVPGWLRFVLVCLACWLGQSVSNAYPTYTIINNRTSAVTPRLVKQNGSAFGFPVVNAGATLNYTDYAYGTVTPSAIVKDTADPSIIATPTDFYVGVDTATTLNFGTPGPTIWKNDTTVFNSSSYTEKYTLTIAPVSGTNEVTQFSLDPGTSYTLNYTGDQKATISYTRDERIYNPDGSLYVSANVPVAMVIPTGSGWYTEGSTPPGATGFSDRPPSLQVDSVSKDGNAIAFNSSSGAASETTLQTGFKSLFTAETDGLDKINQTLLSQVGKQTSLENSLNAGMVNVNGNLTSVKNSVDSASSSALAKLDSVRADLASLSSTVSTKSGEVRGDIQNQTTVLGGKIDSVVSQLSALNTTATGSKTALDGINATLQAMTNGFPVNPSASSQQSQGEAAAASVKGSLDSLAGQLVLSSPGSRALGNWTVTVGGRTFNLNPLADSRIEAMAAWLRQLLVWIVTLAYVLGCLTCVEEYLRAATAARQASSAGTSVMGNNANSVVALAMAAAITVSIGAIPAVAMAVFNQSGMISTIVANPLAGGPEVVRMALALADAFMPLDLIIGNCLLFVVFRLNTAGVFWLSTTAIRFLVG